MEATTAGTVTALGAAAAAPAAPAPPTPPVPPVLPVPLLAPKPLEPPLRPPPLQPSSPPPSPEAGSLAPNGRLRAALEPAAGAAATGAAAATSGGALDTLASDIGTFLAFLPFGASGCSADAEPPERARFASAPAASVPAEAAGVLDPALVLALVLALVPAVLLLEAAL